MKLAQRLLPKWSWAFPAGSHHQLILAAIGRHDAQSIEAARTWLATQDIDRAQFRDHRLLLAIVARFGQQLRDHSAYPRLIGLQRMLWTKSRLAIQEATPSLHSLRAADIDLLLIKGASRLALNEAAGKQRVSWDIDVVVKPECMLRAFDILIAQNWNPSPGTSPQYLREHIPSTRSINLFRGDFGDLDLHSRPFHPGQGGAEEDAALWNAALPAHFAGTSVCVPRCEDRIALALAHGGLDGHTHSDWLVDCALTLAAENCDWRRLQAIILSRNLSASAAITFHYLSSALGHEIPREFLEQLSHAAIRQPLATAAGLIQARPKDRTGPLGQVLRLLAKKQRKRSGLRHLPSQIKDRRLSVRELSLTDNHVVAEFVKSYRLHRSPHAGRQNTLHVDIVLDLPPTTSRRRIEMEINSASAHLCRIRFRSWRKTKSPRRLRLLGTIPNPTLDEPLELISRPGKQLRRYASPSEHARYGQTPFRIISCDIR